MYEADTESVVFGLTGGVTVSFHFAELLVEASGPWIEHRIGRLLSPYLTRLQQRYSSSLQRPGLSRIPKAAWPPAPVVAAPAPAAVPVAAKKAGSAPAKKKKTSRKSPKSKGPAQ